jgi:gliding motility-associated-like protein
VTLESFYRSCPTATASLHVRVYPNPQVDLGPDTAICPGGDPIILSDKINTIVPNARWHWSTGQTTSAIQVGAPGVYVVQITVDGCSSYDSIIVSNDCYLDIPNVFTPNGDGVNDYFFPRQYLTKGLTQFSLQIYNRWGQEIFTSNSTDGRGWDGTYNGVAQPVGVYVYIIDAEFKDGEREHKQGNITLLR